jgi:hypothetical protein
MRSSTYAPTVLIWLRGCRLARAFLAIVRQRRGGAALRAWSDEAASSKLTALVRFAAGLRRDEAAVTAGVTLPWSSGVVEGTNTRIKSVSSDDFDPAQSERMFYNGRAARWLSGMRVLGFGQIVDLNDMSPAE